MVVKMRLYEKKAVDNGRKFKYWEAIVSNKESYLQGYREALEDIKNGIDGSELVEVEFKDGEHQIRPVREGKE